MKTNIPYPDERLLIVRPCHVSLCLGVHSAAKTLSALLYRYSRLCSDDTKEIDQDAVFRIGCKQSDLVKDMIGEITEKTLHDTAIPWLQFLGYLDIEELPGKNCYTLHIGRIFKGLIAYTKDLKNKTHCQLENFLIDVPELKKVLIEVKGLEEFLINKKEFQLQLEKVLIDNRNNSNCQRGRKPRLQATSDGDSESPKINRDSFSRYIERDNVPIGTADETAKLTEQKNNQEIVDANSSSLLTSTRPNTANLDSMPDSQPNGDHHTCVDTPHATKQVEHQTRTDDVKIPIAGTTTRKRKYSKKTSDTTEGPSQELLPGLKEPNLSEKARRVWDIWCQMPWNQGIKLKLTKTAAEHCEELANVEITVDIMFKVKNFATSKKNDVKGYYQGKAWQLGNVVKEYPRWRSSQIGNSGDEESSEADNVISFQRKQTKPSQGAVTTAKVSEEISDRNLKIMLEKVAAMHGGK